MKTFLSAAIVLLAAMASPSTSFSQVVTTIASGIGASGDLEVGPDGNVYVADFGPSLNGGNTGTDVFRVTPAGEVSLFATGFLGASGNAFDSKGYMYQSQIARNMISKIAPDGTISTFTTGPGIRGPVGIAIDAEDNVFSTNCGANSISKTTPDGVSTVLAVSILFACPNGLTILPDGTLYTSNFQNCDVMKITPAGEVTKIGCASTFRVPNTGNGHIVYANDRLYISGFHGGVVYEMPLSGSPVSVLVGVGGSGREDGPVVVARFHQPNGIDATPSGDTLFVNDTDDLQTNFVVLHPNAVRMVTGVLSTITSDEDERPKRSALSLEEMYPNPAVGIVNAAYVLDQSEEVRLELVDMLGRRVHVLDEGIRAAGRHRVALDVGVLTPGVYIVWLSSTSGSAVSKLVVSRSE